MEQLAKTTYIFSKHSKTSGVLDKISQISSFIKRSFIDKDTIQKAIEENNLFTQESITYAINSITEALLDRDCIEDWLSKYEYKDISAKKIGIIMAGNIPLVGFADLLAVLVFGAKPYIKPSSKDRILMEWICNIFKEQGGFKIEYLEKNSNIDALIATGSDNSNRYFKTAYGDIPKLLRGSRTSIAILNGDESSKEIEGLWNDCFLHLGLGCRNISMLFIPENYNLNKISEIFSKKEISHKPLISNYIQHSALLKMKNISFIDGRYYILKESSTLFAPISTINYTRYRSLDEVDDFIRNNNNNIQCIVSHSHIKFGEAQRPNLTDYADDIDTVKFILQ